MISEGEVKSDFYLNSTGCFKILFLFKTFKASTCLVVRIINIKINYEKEIFNCIAIDACGVYF